MAVQICPLTGTSDFPPSPDESRQALAVEEPLEIRLEHWKGGTLHRQSVSITMRTPGHDAELAAGFLFTEGIIRSREEVRQVRSCGPRGKEHPFKNIVRVEMQTGVSVQTAASERNFYTTSSCGICGKTSLEALKIHNPYGQAIRMLSTPSIDRRMLFRLPGLLAARQPVFQETGGCHASGLFDEQGTLLCVREDVGRHNALDKVLGWALMNGHLPLHRHTVLLSGRASFELMQKAAMGGIPIVAAVGAPSTLAVQVAREFNMTLIGFLKPPRLTVYHDPGRIQDLVDIPSEEAHEATVQTAGPIVKAAVGTSAGKSR